MLRHLVESNVVRVAGQTVRRRKASVLILVVALLVLVSLMGTAYISTARVDRYASQQTVANTQIDLLVEGVVAMTEATIVDDLFGTVGSARVFRPTNGTGYEDGENFVDDPWLADRVPTFVTPNVVWPNLSQSLTGAPFDSPLGALTHTRTNMRPSSKTVIYGNGSQRVYPAFAVGSDLPIAADADGDGIADAGLWRLPVSPIDGLTYYAGVRIIDNAAAVNANTAFSRVADYDGAGASATPTGFFPGHIGLVEMLQASGTQTVQQQRDAIANYRTKSQLPGGVLNASPATDPYTDAKAPRSDFKYTTLADAFYMQLGRRLDNPGVVNAAGGRYQALGVPDGMALAYRFCMINPDTSPSPLETLLAASVYTSAPNYGTGLKEYAPNQVGAWFSANFDYSSAKPLRALLVPRNPVSNLMSVATHGAPVWNANADYNVGDWVQWNGAYYLCVGTDSQQKKPNNGKNSKGKSKGNDPEATSATDVKLWLKQNSTTPSKVSVNTATFEELWMAYFKVMKYGAQSMESVPGLVRNPVRDPRASNEATTMTAAEVMLLRAAIAAANSIDMRDADNDVSSFTLDLDVLNAEPKSGNSNKFGTLATVFGMERQPFITEVYANTNTNYVAIEIYNPYDVDILLSNWRICYYDREATTFPNDKKNDFKTVYTFGPSEKIVAGTYRVFDSKGMPTRPGAVTNATAINGLEAVLGKEMVLFRPRKENGQFTSVSDPGKAEYKKWFNESSDASEMVPLDQFDFTNFTANNRMLHYVRANGSADPWRFVASGPYNVHAASTLSRYGTWAQVDAHNAPLTIPLGLGGEDAAVPSTQKGPALQLPRTAGHNVVNTTSNLYPFGGFARDGDILKVPFVGAYTIGVRQDKGNYKLQYLLSVNSLPMDLSQADDQDSANDAFEVPGHFVPLAASPLFSGTDTYAWASDLFDYLSVRNPQHDFFPNTDPAKYNVIPAAPPLAVANTSPAIKNYDPLNPGKRTEDAVPLEGLVNINTAPWRVLAALPMVTDATKNEAQVTALNEALAKAIVAHRETNGPFKSIFDLNKVFDTSDNQIDLKLKRGFWNGWGTITFDSNVNNDPNDAQGDFSPFGSTKDGVREDYEEYTLMINRISNLVTTRSDSFTCYLVIQGWRNAGTNTPELVTQRRAAFIIDRSNVTGTGTNPRVTRIPTN